MKIKRSCFAHKERNGIPECNCLKGLYCEDCPFYKNKKDVKNNIFYEYSFRNHGEFIEALNKHCSKYGIGHLEDFEEDEEE